MDRVQYVLEIAAQILGAFAGSILLRFSLPGTDLTHPFVAMGGISTGHPLSTFIWYLLADLKFLAAFLRLCECAGSLLGQGVHCDGLLRLRRVRYGRGQADPPPGPQGRSHPPFSR